MLTLIRTHNNLTVKTKLRWQNRNRFLCKVVVALFLIFDQIQATFLLISPYIDAPAGQRDSRVLVTHFEHAALPHITTVAKFSFQRKGIIRSSEH